MFAEVYRLWDRRGMDGAPVRGLSCDAEGIYFAGECPLVLPVADETGRMVYRVRALDEIEFLLSIGHGRKVAFAERMPALRQIADRMTAGELAHAQIATMLLKLRELPDAATVARVALADGLLRFNPYHQPAGAPDGIGGLFAPTPDGPIGPPLPPSETPCVADYDKFKAEIESRKDAKGNVQPVGDGQCVALVKRVPGIPQIAHEQWRPGASLADRPNIPEGTAIATFGPDGKYPNNSTGQHAAIFLRYGVKGGKEGIRVYDQYKDKSPGESFIAFNNDISWSRNANAYSVIRGGK
jgi:hypothetical protein